MMQTSTTWIDSQSPNSNVAPPPSPCSLAPQWVIESQSAPYQVQVHGKQEVITGPSHIPLDMTCHFIPPPNPTFPINPPPAQSAIDVLQQSLHSVVAMKPSIPNDSSIPPTVIPTVQSQYYRPDALAPPQIPHGVHELSIRAPRNEHEAVLVERWSTKLAMSSLESEFINETASIWRHRVREELVIKWQNMEQIVRLRALEDLQHSASNSKYDANGMSMDESDGSKTFEFNVSDQKVYDAIIIDLITRCDKLYLDELRSTMSTADLTQSVGMMKGTMDGLRDQIKMASMRYPQCTTDTMRHQFEIKILPTWCSLLLIATNDIRNALRVYLCDEAFYPYFYFGTAINGEMARILESGDLELTKIRDPKEQREFMSNTRKQHDKMVLLLDHLSIKGHHNAQHRDAVVFNHMLQQGNLKRNLQCLEVPPAQSETPKRKRRKCRHHLFRKDGTLRKSQINPCISRRCKKMWQSDGITKGCGGGTHPRGVCPCWKAFGFTKVQAKDGTIQKWLEKRYGVQGGKFGR